MALQAVSKCPWDLYTTSILEISSFKLIYEMPTKADLGRKMQPRARPVGRKYPIVRVRGAVVKIINPGSNKRRRIGPLTLTPSYTEPGTPACIFCREPTYPASSNLGELFGPYQACGQEVWMHLDCVLWVPGVIMVSGKLLGLEEGIEQCKSLICSVCDKVGASVGCTHHGCEETVHVGCGQGGGGWLLDEDKLDAKCPGHNLRNDTKQRHGRNDET